MQRLSRLLWVIWAWIRFKYRGPAVDYIAATNRRLAILDRKHRMEMAAFDFEMAVITLPKQKMICEAPVSRKRSFHGSNLMLENSAPVYGFQLNNVSGRVDIRYGEPSNVRPAPTFGTPASYVPKPFPKAMYKNSVSELAQTLEHQYELEKHGWRDHY